MLERVDRADSLVAVALLIRSNWRIKSPVSNEELCSSDRLHALCEYSNRRELQLFRMGTGTILSI